MDEKWYISATFELVEEFKEEAMAALKDLINETRKEPGCISYILTQDRSDPRKYMFLETWANEASFRAHGNAPHIQTFRKRIEGKRSAVAITTLKQVS